MQSLLSSTGISKDEEDVQRLVKSFSEGMLNLFVIDVCLFSGNEQLQQVSINTVHRTFVSPTDVKHGAYDIHKHGDYGENFIGFSTK